MAGEFSVAYESGLTLYALIFDPASAAWNGTAFVDPAGGAWPTCALPMTDDGEGGYSAAIPDEVPAGNYLVQAYLQLGPTPVDTDPLVGTGAVYWPGAGVAPVAGGFRAGVVARLNGSAALAAIVGDRIFPQIRPQRSGLPAVVFSIPSIERDHDLDGPTGLATAYLEMVAYAEDFTECDRLAQVLRDLFDGFTGQLGAVEVTETLSDSEVDDWDTTVDGADDGTYSIQVDYQITYRESTPNRES